MIRRALIGLGLVVSVGSSPRGAKAQAPAPEKPPAAAPAPPQGNAPPLSAAEVEERSKTIQSSKESDKLPPEPQRMVEIVNTSAYVSLPTNRKPPLPGIVLIHEWWGLNDPIKRFADKLANEGYAVMAVDLYGGKVATVAPIAMAYKKAVDEKRAMEILHAAFDYLASTHSIRATRRGCIGFCFGGGWSLRLALAEPRMSADVIYYGDLVTDAAKLKALQCPVLGVFGNRDESILPKVVDEFEAGLKAAGVPHEILRYDAVHAFANPSNPKYDAVSADAAWVKVRAFLDANLRKPAK